MSTAVTTAFRIHCRRCDVFTVVSRDDALAVWNDPAAPARCYSALPCRLCGTWYFANGVSAKRGKRPCGSWCTEGYGLSCTCECGGANHGRDLALTPGELANLR